MINLHDDHRDAKDNHSKEEPKKVIKVKTVGAGAFR